MKILKAIIFIGVIGLASASVIPNENDAKALNACLGREMWGDENPNKYWICHDKKPMEMTCDEGKGFVGNHTSFGCIPYEQWSDLCVPHKHPHLFIDCLINEAHPWPTNNPNTFAICINNEPIQLECLDEKNKKGNKGFVYTDDYLGCFDWKLWRQYSGCGDSSILIHT